MPWRAPTFEVPLRAGVGAVMYAENSIAVALLASAVRIAWTSGEPVVAVSACTW